MPKILKPYTIIPPYLYVQRDADRQLKNIIKDMGRPGYVLVSRQMGKTNLLLNAKRNLETENDVFVYVDLSNIFSDAKSCFENIINTAIETNEEKFAAAGKTIYERRPELGHFPAHKQHTSELRLLLQALEGGKLVIILDEIDALTKTDYSDQIFSQIRSSYFGERVNYKEFSRLTYILSGVVEPTEIIKDAKISPFNIGQKIFLNDFSRAEFEQFLILSEIQIDQLIKERIFYWTNGNPRMTWDLCSQVENFIKDHENIDAAQVDKLVADLYLTSFDKPPIDNIREIVIKDKDLRQAVSNILSGQAKTVSDKIKSKLYLAGIINYDDNEVHIKNQIITESLSLKWVRSLDVDELGVLRLGRECYAKGDYENAAAYYYKYLETNDFPEDDRDVDYFYLATMEFNKGLFEQALAHAELAQFDVEDVPVLYYGHLNLKGLIYNTLKDYEKSQLYWSIVRKGGLKDEIYIKSSIGLAYIYMNNFLGVRTDEAESIYSEIANPASTFKRLAENSMNYYRCMGLYNLALIAQAKNDLDKARRDIETALPIADNDIKPAFLKLLADITPDGPTKTKVFQEIIDFIRTYNVKPKEQLLDGTIDVNDVQIKDVLLSIYEISPATFDQTVKDHLKLDGADLAQQMFEIGIHGLNKQNWNISQQVFRDLYDRIKTRKLIADINLEFYTVKYFAYSNNYADPDNFFQYYLELFRTINPDIIDFIDLTIFSNVIYQLSETKRYEEALDHVRLIDSCRDRVDSGLQVNYMVIYHLELNIYLYQQDHVNALKKANQIIEMSEEPSIKDQQSTLLGEAGLDVIRKNALQIVNPRAVIRTPVKTAKIFGRNDRVKVRYQDGVIIEAKYKRVETDIAEGKCFILTEELLP